ncbi:MAG: alpha/beta hydrolase [Bdellovibrionales bacterium]|nr:alpha/beta hydrolase [Bdellovibrionales bacterium]
MGAKILNKDFPLFWHKAKVKKHPETIVLVHHMWGSHKTTRLHYFFLNELGYDCVSFDLILGSSLDSQATHPYVRYVVNGVFAVWTKQIHQALDQIEGKKIIFAFSGPSLSALSTAAKRSDVEKVICDGGPFEDIYSNTINFFKIVVGLPGNTLPKIASFFGTSVWGLAPLAKLHRKLDHWNPEIPILSIRGREDDIVALSSIESLFNKHPHLPLDTLVIDHGKHLDGLKNYPQIYKAKVSQFLSGDV